MNGATLIQWMNVPLFHVGQTAVTFGSLGAGILIFIGMLILSSAVQVLLNKHLRSRRNFSTSMIYAFNRIIHYLFIIVGIVLAAQCIGLNFGTLAVVFGFLGVGIGFGLQNMTANFISGLILLIERPIGVGDLVDVDNKIAEVKSINMRSTTVRTFDNVTVIVPNSKFIENNVINWTFEDPRVRLHCPVGVAYGSDVQKVKEVLLGVAMDHPEVMQEPVPEVRFLEFADSSLNFDLLIWTPRPENQKILRSEINFLIDAAFRKHNIHIPFPQRDLHLQMSPAVEQLSGRKKKTEQSED